LIGGILQAIGLIVVLVVLVAGYLGFVPILSDLMGAGPRDLGIHPTAADAVNAMSKIGNTELALNGSTGPQGSIRLEGNHHVDTVLTAEEITAAQNARNYKYDPIRNVQVKINSDNTVETSGRLSIPKAKDYLRAIGYTESEIDQALSAAKDVPGEAAFYAKGTVSMTNNVLSTDISEAKIGNVQIPKDQLSNGALASIASSLISKNPGVSVDKFEIVDGKAHFVGTYPDKTYLAPN
jgi:hypothetical protein